MLYKLFVFIGLQIISFPCFQFGAKENVSDLHDFIKRNNLNIGDIFHPIEVCTQLASWVYEKYLIGSNIFNNTIKVFLKYQNYLLKYKNNIFIF